VRALRAATDRVFLHDLVAEYIVRLVLATRSPREFGLDGLERLVAVGASPRATLGLAAAARASALLNGRDHVLPTDVASQAVDVIAHRLVLTFDAIADEVDPRVLVEQLVERVPQPQAIPRA
jgi:MoxR-like ATPase